MDIPVVNILHELTSKFLTKKMVTLPNRCKIHPEGKPVESQLPQNHGCLSFSRSRPQESKKGNTLSKKTTLVAKKKSPPTPPYLFFWGGGVPKKASTCTLPNHPNHPPQSNPPPSLPLHPSQWAHAPRLRSQQGHFPVRSIFPFPFPWFPNRILKGLNTTQLYRDYFINHDISGSRNLNQPGFNGMSQGF